VTLDAEAVAEVTLGPQPGPQEAFLSSSADVAIYGGQAGGGKSFGLLLEAARHIENPRYGGVIFRRSNPEIMNEGGLWDTSMTIYPSLGGVPIEGKSEWRFPEWGSTIRFAHLEHEKSRLSWGGSQVPFFGWDELTTFTEKQFWYMLIRNRSDSGVRGYMRATTNPDADSWVARLVKWWVDQETGYAIPERSGILRWMHRQGDEILWADSPEELIAEHPDALPKSFTFIPSSIYDNPILLKGNPDYLASLKALHLIERERMLRGNWKIRAEAGNVFNRDNFEVIAALPAGWRYMVRQWDKASSSDGDWTAGVLLAYYPSGMYVVVDVKRVQFRPGARETLIKNTASQDGRATVVGLFQDPAAAGVTDLHATVTMLAGYSIEHAVVSGDKVTMASPCAAQAEVGNIKVLRAEWNEDFLAELHAFPTRGIPDDQVDGLTGAFNTITRLKSKLPTKVSSRGA
jgi:predicted phage terminase large subunit-like protein